MNVNTLTVIGTPLECGIDGCKEPASVSLRQVDTEGNGMQMLFCDTCWLATRRAYTPLVAHDAQSTVQDMTEALVRRQGGTANG